MTDEQISRLQNLDIDLNEVDLDGATLQEDFDELNINIDDFDDAQIRQIADGLENTSVEEVSLYANPDFMPDQMRQVASGSDAGLDADAVSAIADPVLTESEMGSMRISLENGLSPEGLKDNLLEGEDKLYSILNFRK